MAGEPVPVHILWPNAERGPWLVTIWWREQYGAPAPVGYAMHAWDSGINEALDPDFCHVMPLADADQEFAQIGSQLIRSVPIGQLLDESRAKLTRQLREMPDLAGQIFPAGWEHLPWSPNDEKESLALADSLEGRRGGRYLGAEHYREVAEVYRKAVQAGGPPTKAVADHFAVSKSAAAKKVARAREAGLLPKTTRGRKGPASEEL